MRRRRRREGGGKEVELEVVGAPLGVELHFRVDVCHAEMSAGSS